MPRVSDRQLALKHANEAVEAFLLFEMFGADEEQDLLEVMMYLLPFLENQRYICRPPAYNMKAEMRRSRIELLLSYDDRHFAIEARMSKVCFWRLVELVKDNPVFSNRSYREQDPVHHQLLVTLFRLGCNGSGIGHTASYLACGDGTTEVFTWRCLKAIYDLRGEFITWPKANERATIAARIAHNHIFGNCVGMMDGSLVPIEQRPGIPGANDYYTRKHCYALNVMAICDDGKRIRALITGWPGAVNDQRVFDMSPVSSGIRHSLSTADPPLL